MANAIQTKIEAVYRSARSVTMLRAQGQDLRGSHELADPKEDAAGIQAKARLIYLDAKSPDDVFDLAVRHGLIQAVV
jgi:hypothetical protein